MNAQASQIDQDQQAIAVAIAALLNGDSTAATRTASDEAYQRLDPTQRGFELDPCWNTLWERFCTDSRQHRWPPIPILIAIGIALFVVLTGGGRALSFKTNRSESPSVEQTQMHAPPRHDAP